MTPSERLAATVLANDLCIGCGACTLVHGSPFRIEENAYGMYEARAQPGQSLADTSADVLSVCPFSANARSETEISAAHFGRLKNNSDHLGSYISCYSGHVTDKRLRQSGSSGAIGRWVLSRLLESNEVDHVVHVLSNRRACEAEPLFLYAIDSDPGQVLATAKSAYHPVTLSAVLEDIRSQPGRYAVSGLPCFIKAIRLLTSQDAVLRDRIKFTVGLICGGLKSKHYSEAIAWEQGIPPADLARIDFRKKFADKPAHFKGNEVESKFGQSQIKSSKELFVTDYGMGFFKPNACDYCDDVVGEVADLSVGDAWLPHLVLDPQGTSIVITRNAKLEKLITEGANDGALKLNVLPEKQAVLSQSGGFRHRREGLSYRLEKKLGSGQWAPPKRVEPKSIADGRRRAIYDLREQIAHQSHIEYSKARNNGSYDSFIRAMQPLVSAYNRAYGRGIMVRVFSKLSLLVVSSRTRLSRIIK